MNWLALDIGGANLKYADGKGRADHRPFALWKKPKLLAQELRTLIAEAPDSDHLAVTMTGELADCFADKAAGVNFILQAVQQASGGRHARVYLSDGKLVTLQVAASKPHLAAASNWHALAKFAARCAKHGTAILIDVGSTTCDIIPLQEGVPVATGHTDTERLLSGELVYTGVERSPVCALISTAPYRERLCAVAQELFATTYDVYILLGDLAEDLTATHTADGRPATKAAARCRLGRMICADGDLFNHRDAVAIARTVADAQVAMIASAARRVVDRLAAIPDAVILSGQGEFVGRRVLEKLAVKAKIVSLADELGPVVSRCAPAHALAVLAREATGA